MPRKSKKKLTEEQLDTLFECWKDADTYQDRLKLIEQRMPDVPALPALGIMRKMAKHDARWLRMGTRRKNQKEREKLEKKQAREKKIAERENRRKEREEKRKEREEQSVQKMIRTKLLEGLEKGHVGMLTDRIGSKFFFCQEAQQFVHVIPCIFKVFSKEYDGLLSGPCEKCVRMDEYIQTIEEVIDGGQKGPTGHKTSKGRRKDTKETASSAAEESGAIEGYAGCEPRHSGRRTAAADGRSHKVYDTIERGEAGADRCDAGIQQTAENQETCRESVSPR
jgi:hypothetical protein